MQYYSGICIKPKKLLSGNGQLIGAETGIYSDFHLEEYPQDGLKLNIEQNIKFRFTGFICYIKFEVI